MSEPTTGLRGGQRELVCRGVGEGLSYILVASCTVRFRCCVNILAIDLQKPVSIDMVDRGSPNKKLPKSGDSG